MSEEVNEQAPERVWITGYTAGPKSGALSHGLYFRSIHDSADEAERYARHQQNTLHFSIHEYVLSSVAEAQLAAVTAERDALVTDKGKMRAHIQALIVSESEAVTSAGLLQSRNRELVRITGDARDLLQDHLAVLIGSYSAPDGQIVGDDSMVEDHRSLLDQISAVLGVKQ